MLKKTPLNAMHKAYHGKMVDFSGWELPVQYTSIVQEHRMVREKAGLFDVSHMGEIIVQGAGAEDFIQKLLSNDIKKIRKHQVQYNIMCYPAGGVVDDLVVYKYSDSDYLLVVNAANVDKDFAWIQEHAPAEVTVKNVSSDYAQLAVQGPQAQTILQKLTDYDLNSIKFFHFVPRIDLAGASALVSRTGYTGEDGLEVYLKPDAAAMVWEAILQAGGDDICPVGLGARDTLRFEAKLPLYGQEISQDINPLEAGLGFFVKLDKDDFVGRDALAAAKNKGLSRTLVELNMTGKGIPRSHYPVVQGDREIGWVTSGAFAPTLGKPVALALVDADYSAEGTEVAVMIRNKPVPAQVVENLFYSKKTKSK